MNKEQAIQLVKVVNNIKDTSPLLLVGEAYLVFRKKYNGKIIEVTKDNVKEIVEYYSSVTLPYPLVLEDISSLSATSVNYLLKLIEEAKYPIILLSSYDNMNNILLSRIKTFMKVNASNTSEFREGKEALDLIADKLDKEMSYKDKLETIGNISPIYYKVNKEVSGLRNKDKYINILI